MFMTKANHEQEIKTQDTYARYILGQTHTICIAQRFIKLPNLDVH